MKKVILSVFVVGSLLATSCKQAKEAKEEVKEATETVVEKTGDAANTVVEETKEVVEEAKEVVEEAVKTVESAIEGVTIPEFKDPKVGEHLKAYSEYAKEYIAEGKDAYKNVALVKKGADLLAKGKEIVGGLDEEASKKFNSVMTAIQAKMAPAK
ncbi:hypothetical protein ACSIGC_13475 [Tenacibaculum sp. ZS6-P6]|uniref:hypothetical protein n=1 Tax=Tenacibaculum sp. ZS6-P6 TaxID=3447503 RepID=UPI003F98A08F